MNFEKDGKVFSVSGYGFGEKRFYVEGYPGLRGIGAHIVKGTINGRTHYILQELIPVGTNGPASSVSKLPKFRFKLIWNDASVLSDAEPSDFVRNTAENGGWREAGCRAGTVRRNEGSPL